MSAFENIFDIRALVQLIVNETNRYAQQEILKNVNPFIFSFRLEHGQMLQRTKCTWFCLSYVHGCCIKAYTYIILLKEQAAIHSVFFWYFTSGNTWDNNQMYAFFWQQWAKWILRTSQTFQNVSNRSAPK
jgi:uncharacterized membrane protein